MDTLPKPSVRYNGLPQAWAIVGALGALAVTAIAFAGLMGPFLALWAGAMVAQLTAAGVLAAASYIAHCRDVVATTNNPATTRWHCLGTTAMIILADGAFAWAIHECFEWLAELFLVGRLPTLSWTVAAIVATATVAIYVGLSAIAKEYQN